MVSFEYTVKDELGLHARPVGVLVKEVKNYDSHIMLNCNGKSADAGRLLAIMGMGVKCGDLLTVTVEGNDEEGTAKKFEEFLKANV